MNKGDIIRYNKVKNKIIELGDIHLKNISSTYKGCYINGYFIDNCISEWCYEYTSYLYDFSKSIVDGYIPFHYLDNTLSILNDNLGTFDPNDFDDNIMIVYQYLKGSTLEDNLNIIDDLDEVNTFKVLFEEWYPHISMIYEKSTASSHEWIGEPFTWYAYGMELNIKHYNNDSDVRTWLRDNKAMSLGNILRLLSYDIINNSATNAKKMIFVALYDALVLKYNFELIDK